MIFAFSEEQEQLRATVRRFLADKSPESEVRRLMETVPGYDPEVWRQAAGQLGLAGLTIPEKFGGSGYGYVELTVVFEEMGRALLCAPFFATVVLAANLLLSTDDESAKADYLPGIACGRCHRHRRARRAVGPVGRGRRIARGGRDGRRVDADRREAVRAGRHGR